MATATVQSAPRAGLCGTSAAPVSARALASWVVVWVVEILGALEDGIDSSVFGASAKDFPTVIDDGGSRR